MEVQPEVTPSASPRGLSDEPSLMEDAWHLLMRRRNWIIAPALVGLVIAFFWVRSLPSEYTSSALIRISNSNSAAMQLESNPVGSALGAESPDIETEITVLQSRILALSVADVLNLYSDTRLSLPVKGEGSPGANNPISRFRMLGVFSGALSVTRQIHTNAIQISVKTASPELSATIANALVNQYIARNYQMRFASQQGVSDWLGKQLDDLRKQTEAAQQRTLEYQKKLGILNTAEAGSGKSSSGDVQSLAAKRIETLEQALTDAQSGRIIKEAQYRILSSDSPEYLPDNANPVLGDLRRQRAALIVQIQEMSQKYGSSYPPLKQLKAGLDEATASIATQQVNILGRVQSELNAARASEQSLRTAIEKEKRDADLRSDDVIQYTIAKREFQSSYELYEGLLGKLKEAGVLAGLHSSNVDIIDPAIAPNGPSGPHRTRFALGGFLVGLLFGVVIAFLIDSFDKSILSGDYLEQVTGLPTLGLIPTMSRTKIAVAQTQLAPDTGARILASHSPVHAEAFRALRTSVLLSRPSLPPKIILLTSSLPSEGKSTVSLNLAWVLAQSAAKVLIIDGDLRRPSLMRSLNLPSLIGLCNVLTGTSTFEESVIPLPGDPRLFLLPTGPLPPNPAELLSSEAFANCLEKARSQFDFVIIDSPPVLSVTDPLVISPLVDGVLFVVRSGATNRHMIQRACRILQRSASPLLGSVLNWIDVSSGEYGYYQSTEYYTQAENRKKKDQSS
jgi:succinoglycan biosynthesis transport protein ExoP